ncbi:MAG: 30S ribosomal protein S17 [Candidatus Sungbacteria bacterium RIFCSPLOWO2_12_FULL_41_11]|uniref:Small ribosomal subunit protein uS17 n=1 Tax=Candidatus Sungbacteria bacterium RIFCSPLOWO2_12_FULL_41_11 TaxID=1802286 RepID=A0A1G2LQN1_9BACT|nr:MAG: 30S ribosomal protein S17 [Candidatus Sungbacteria bacterium RIFCSPLOWO2_12_FULL_41_11]
MRKLKGTIISNKMAKTVVVRVDSLKKHSKYQKFYKVSKKYKVHDDKGEYKAGDIVMIQETRPFSKEKRWKVSELVKRAQVAEPEAENEIAG